MRMKSVNFSTIFKIFATGRLCFFFFFLIVGCRGVCPRPRRRLNFAGRYFSSVEETVIAVEEISDSLSTTLIDTPQKPGHSRPLHCSSSSPSSSCSSSFYSPSSSLLTFLFIFLCTPVVSQRIASNMVPVGYGPAFKYGGMCRTRVSKVPGVYCFMAVRFRLLTPTLSLNNYSRTNKSNIWEKRILNEVISFMSYLVSWN